MLNLAMAYSRFIVSNYIDWLPGVYVFDFTPPQGGGGGKWLKRHLGEKYEKVKKRRRKEEEKKKKEKNGEKCRKIEKTGPYFS
jgi:hypothetical protein